MSTGITNRWWFVFPVLGCLLCQNASGAEVGIAGIEVAPKLRYATWTESETRSNIATAIGKELFSKLDASSHVVSSLETFQEILSAAKVDFAKPKERTVARYGELAAHASCRFLLYMQVRKIEQKNLKPGEILAAPGRAASETKVEVAFELFDAKENLIKKFGDKLTLRGVDNGPYFGTVERDEISTDPATRAIVIRNEHRKRMEAIARATWNAAGQLLLDLLKGQ